MDKALSFGPWIRARRKLLGLKIEDVAKAVPYATDFLYRIERGVVRPPRPNIEKIADVLRVSPERKDIFVLFGLGIVEQPFLVTEDIVIPKQSFPCVRIYKLAKEEPESFAQFLEEESISELWLVGQTLQGLITGYLTPLKQKAMKAATAAWSKKYHFIVMDPDDESLLEAAVRSRTDCIDPKRERWQQLRDMLTISLTSLEDLYRITAKGTIECKTVKFVLGYIYIIARTREGPYDRMIVEPYAHKISPRARYKIFLTRSQDADFFAYHEDRVLQLWEDGTPVDLTGGLSRAKE